MNKILLVDDDISFLKVHKKILIKNGYDVTVTSDPLEALKLMKQKDFSIVITDMVMPKVNGLQLLKEVKEESEDIEVIVLTGKGTIHSAVQAMKEGAYTYLSKPIDYDELLLEIKKCFDLRKLRDENTYLKERILQGKDDFLGESLKIKEIKEKIGVIAPTSASVLITGESGTGKELVAELIHYNSKRKDKPLIKVNCASLAESVLESELFGHEKGAFTGAVNRHKGRFELANGGTLFLDEIGEISINMQTKLLRVLQEKEFERVGGTKTIITDFRLIAATNKDLKKEVAKGHFREDLYYRLNVIPMDLPPLKERSEDILLIARYFLEKYALELNKDITGFSPEVEKLLIQYDWPGNIRELKNIIERLVVFTEGKTIYAKNLPEEIKRKNAVSAIIKDFKLACKNFEISFLEEALQRNDWNISRTAKEIGLARKNLQAKIKKYRLKNKKCNE